MDDNQRRGGGGKPPSYGKAAPRKPGFAGKPSAKPSAGRGPAPAAPPGGKPAYRMTHGKPVPPPRPALPDARKVALAALTDVVRNGAYSQLALSKHLTNAKHLSPEDRRLAAGIFHAALENRLKLSYILSQFIARMPGPEVEDVLHIAAAQLLLMDRVPDHAAVDEAVKQARSMGFDGFSKLVNGALRNLIRARDGGTIQYPDKALFPIRHLSIAHSLPEPIVQRIASDYGMDEAERIIAYRPSERHQVARPNLLQQDGRAFAVRCAQLGWAVEPGIVPGAYRVSGASDMAGHPDFKKGLFSLISEPSMLSALACEPSRGQQILDACAAPGGKSAMLCELMGGSGRVHAWDVHEHRVALIRAQKERLGLDNLRPAVRDARMHRDELDLSLDAVLVDAPCSGLGVTLEKPDIKYRVTLDDIDALAKIQAEILDACCGYVKPGGLLVYSTCTITPAENGEQVKAFLARHPEFEMEQDVSYLPESLRPLAADGMLQLLPYRDGMEGFFIARMRKKRA